MGGRGVGVEEGQAPEGLEKRMDKRKLEKSSASSSSESTKPPKKSGKLGPRLGEVKEEDPPDWSALEVFSSPWKRASLWKNAQAQGAAQGAALKHPLPAHPSSERGGQEGQAGPRRALGKEQRVCKDCALGKGQRAEYLEGPAQGGAHCGLAQHPGGPGLPARLQSRGLGKGHEGSRHPCHFMGGL